MKTKIKEYKLNCAICRSKVVRKTNLKRAICAKCKTRYYEKTGSKEKKQRNALILHMDERGFNGRQIAEMFKITKQRVYQILKFKIEQKREERNERNKI